MRVLVVGATGVIGSAVADALAAEGHEVLRASRKGEISVDLTRSDSIHALYRQVGRVGAVISCAGSARPGAVTALSDEDWAASFAEKVMGNINLVRFGIDSVEDQGVFVLTGGIWSQKPPPGVVAYATSNGALESFARAAARDLPRGLRIVTVSPPWIEESARLVGQHGVLTAAENAKFYVRALSDRSVAEVIYPS
jgi:NAD(P)-dependent dehydrogenase (short-subunit alcohol dehydrogenase family)